MARGPGQPLKSLNTGPGSKRFVFKSAAELLDELEIDVFRSLAPVKFQPSQGSSFFHESLIAWKELNAAADFNEVYQQLFPLVQTLPQLLLHKDKIVQVLIAHVRIDARLSLEPILSLVSDLARDLGAEFLPFLQPLLLVYVDLLQSGGVREPVVLGQVFKSVASIFKHTSEALKKDIPLVLTVSRPLRLYSESHVQEFSAEAVGYLFRSCSLKQLRKGIRCLFTEVVHDISDESITASSWLLSFAMKGSASLHSRAERVLACMLDSSLVSPFLQRQAARKALLKAIWGVFLHLLEDIDRNRLELLWSFLTEQILKHLSTISDIVDVRHTKLHGAPLCSSSSTCITAHEDEPAEPVNFHDSEVDIVQVREQDKETEQVIGEPDDKNFHLSLLLALLANIVEFKRGQCVTDYKPLISLVPRLLQLNVLCLRRRASTISFAGPLSLAKLNQRSQSGLPTEILRFLLALVRSHSQPGNAERDPAYIVAVAPSWAGAFGSDNVYQLIPFIRGLVNLGLPHVSTFAPWVLGFLDRFVDMHPVQVLPLVVDVCKELGWHSRPTLHQYSADTKRIMSYLVTLIGTAVMQLKSLVERGNCQVDASLTDPALLWAGLECFPYAFAHGEEHGDLAWEYAAIQQQVLESATGESDDLRLQKSLLGAALCAHVKLLEGASASTCASLLSHFLDLAWSHGDSPHVLGAVVDFLSALKGQGEGSTVYPAALGSDAIAGALEALHLNLSSPEKSLRIATLQLLTYFEPLDLPADQGSDERAGEALKHASQNQLNSRCQVVQQLLSVESAPASVENSRQSVRTLSHIRVDICSGRVPLPYVVPLAHAMIGLMQNRFLPLWDAAALCLASLIEAHSTVVWDVFIQQLSETQESFLLQPKHSDGTESHETLVEDVWSNFDVYVSSRAEHTADGSLLGILIKTLQKIPVIAERHSRVLVPLFLGFVGQGEDVGKDEVPFKASGGKDWKNVLREWLVLLKECRNARSLYRGPDLKTVLLKQLLMDRDSAIQQLVLECLLNWKDSYLTSYREHLSNLISYRTLREELTTWNVARDGGQVLEEHRNGLIPVLLQILFPKIMKRNGKISGKAVAGVQRSAVLGYLLHLDIQELSPFFCQILRPLQGVFAVGEDSGFDWEAALGQSTITEYIAHISEDEVARLPYKKKIGFLYMFQDLLGTFDRVRLGAYLQPLLALVFKFMAAAVKQGTGLNQLLVVRASKLANMEIEPPECTMQEDNDSSVKQSPCSLFDTCQQDNVEAEASECSDRLQKSGGAHDMLDPGTRKRKENSRNDECLEEDGGHPPKRRCTSSGSEKDIRLSCFTIVATVLTKFEDLVLPDSCWDIFFSLAEMSLGRFQKEQAVVLPVALCDCFLAMSRRMDLAPLLVKDRNLLHNILATLSFKGTSGTSVAFVLCFIENILNLESDSTGEEEPQPVHLILLPHLHQLLCGLQDVLLNHKEYASRPRSGAVLGRVLKILTRLSTFIKGATEANSLMSVLLPVLKRKRRIQDEEFLEVLCVLRGLANVVDVRTANKCLLALAPLLTSESGKDVQTVVCDIFKGLADVLPSLSPTVKLLDDLMSMSARGLEEVDYGRRLNAYEALNEAAFSQMTWSGALLILSVAVRDIASEDRSLRLSSKDCVNLFIKFAASVPDQGECLEVDEKHTVLKDGESVVWDGVEAVADKPVNSLVRSFLLPQARIAMNSDVATARDEWVSLLRETILRFPSIPSLHDCRPLASEDLEVDFFYNIVHLQVHRKIKAMARFRATLAGHRLSEGVLVRLFAPLFRSLLFEAKKDKEGNLIGAAIESIACIAAQLQWDPYFGLLMQSFRLVSSRPEHQKTVARLISSILDEFHFPMVQSHLSERDGNGALHEAAKDVDLSRGSSEGLLVAADNREERLLPADICRVLQMKVLPDLRKLMTLEKDNINTSLAVSAVKILKFLPEETMKIELPPLVQSIVNLLKSHRQGIRDDARAALIAVTKALGAQYLEFVVNIMQFSLTKGFELHVLGFTVNSILLKLLPEVKVGEVDHCLGKLQEILLSGFLGEVAEEKDVEGIARKMKETRRMQSLESMQLLASSVFFPAHAMTLLKPVIDSLDRSMTPKEKNKIQQVLKALAIGIQSNPSVTENHLLVFVEQLIEGLHGIQESSDNSMLNSRQNIHMTVDFALNVLHSNLKTIKVNSEDQDVLSMLAHLVDLLQICLASKYDSIVSLALKCLRHLLKLPLPTLRSVGDRLTTDVLSIAQRCGTAETEVMKASFDLLIALIRHPEVGEVSQEQLHALLEFPIFNELEGHTCGTSLNLLKAVIARKVLVPELYDIVHNVEELMIRSQVEAVRKQANQVVLQFMLDYPLGSKRLQQHLDFFLTNTSYSETTGRESALEMLHTVISKFPEALVEEQAESMFLVLVTRVANEEASHVRAMLATVLKGLFCRISQPTLDRIFDYSIAWYSNPNPRLWRPSAQVLGYLVEVMGSKLGRHTETVVNCVVSFLKHAIKVQEPTEDERAPLWQEVYLSLLMVEKLLQKNPDLCLQQVLEGFWDLVPSFLLHEHTWPRRVSERLVGVYFAACGLLSRSELETMISTKKQGCLVYRRKLIQLAAAFIDQLDCGSLDADLNQLAVHNLLFVTCLFDSVSSGMKSSLQDPGETGLSARDELGVPNKCDPVQEPLATAAAGVPNGSHPESRDDAVYLIFAKVEKIALKIHPVQSKAALQWFSAMATQLGERIQAYLPCMLRPLYKISGGYTARLVTDDLQMLAAEVSSLLRDTIGAHKFESAYNVIREEVQGRRTERKQSEKTLVFKNPEAAAKRKLGRAVKKRSQKRRKILEAKVERGL